MKCIYLVLLLIVIAFVGLSRSQDEGDAGEPAVVEETAATDDDAKSSDPDTFEEEEDEMELNNLEKRLPSGYESVMTKVVDSNFSCKERETGFFADVDNDCQVFHRCLSGDDRVYSFYCPEDTIFSQRELVCVWRGTRGLDCADSEDFYDESNRAFFNNFTALERVRQNVKNSAEIIPISSMEVVEGPATTVAKNEVHSTESSQSHELQTSSGEEDPIKSMENNSIEEMSVSTASEEFSVADSGDYHSDAEIIPHIQSGPDASIASSSISSEDGSLEVLKPHKIIKLGVFAPIIEMPTVAHDEVVANVAVEDQEAVFESRHRQKLFQPPHRRGFLFKADA